MHTSYTVGITTGEYRALQYVMVDQNDWVNNALKNRAWIASKDIVIKYTQFKVNKGEAIIEPDIALPNELIFNEDGTTNEKKSK